MHDSNGTMGKVPRAWAVWLLILLLPVLPFTVQPTGHVAQPAGAPTHTTLADGRELVLGDILPSGLPAPALLRDPQSGKSESLPVELLAWRSEHTVTVLPDGRVLIAGGHDAQGQSLPNAQLWDINTGQVRSLPLPEPLPPHKAQLGAKGEVLLWTTNQDGNSQAWRLDTELLRLIPHGEKTPPEDEPALALGVSAPQDGAQDVAPDTRIALLFSRPIEHASLSEASVQLKGAEGTVAARRVPTEGGRLLFLLPVKPLAAGTTYTVILNGLRDAMGQTLNQAGPTFATRTTQASSAPPSFIATQADSSQTDTASGREARKQSKGEPIWLPTVNPDGSYHWETGLPPAPAQSQPPLQAASGVTALAGQILRLDGEPLAKVKVEIEEISAYTDSHGRFLLAGLTAGHHELEVEGMTANTKDASYGCYEIGVDIMAGETTRLPYTIWMPVLDTAHAIKIPSPTKSEVVVTSPNLPGLELHIPPDTVILDDDSKPVREITLTPVPVDRPPYPLPANVRFPMYFTAQPGGAYVYQVQRGASGKREYVKGQGIRVYYPNVYHAPPGARSAYWHYDPEDIGWYVYGTGRVMEDGKQFEPEEGVAIYELSGASYYAYFPPPPPGPSPGGGGSGGSGGCGGSGGQGYSLGGDECAEPGKDGEPVDLSTGLFIHEVTDLVIPDIIPITVQRTYRTDDNLPRKFGLSTTHLYEMFLWLYDDEGGHPSYTQADLILPDGGRVHYVRTSPGTSEADAVYEHAGTPSRFYSSRIVWNGNGWDLTLRDGTVHVFDNQSSYGGYEGTKKRLIAIRDRHGNVLRISHNAYYPYDIARITSPNGHSVNFEYQALPGGADYVVKRVSDHAGRQIIYDYDTDLRLIKVTYPDGRFVQYGYGSRGMNTLTDSHGTVSLTNEYDTSDRVVKQTLADGGIYLFNYTTDANGKITQTEVTNPRGYKRRMSFNADGYPLSDTRALGTPEERSYTYVRRSDNLLQEVTNPLGYQTTYNAYDTQGNVLSVTEAANTPAAATWSYSYEPLYSQIKTVTDPLNHVTTYNYFPNGDLQSIVDATGRSVSFTHQPDGRLSSFADGLGNTTNFAYDGPDLVAVTDPNGKTGSFYHDILGRLTRSQNAAGELTRFEYDNVDRLKTITNPLGNSIALDYNDNGFLASLVAPAGGATGTGQTTWSYDNSNRLATRTDPLGRQDRFTLYDLRGNLIEAYDRKNQQRSYTYDPLERLRQVTYADGSTTAYGYDGLGRLLSVTDSLSGDIARQYDPLGRLLGETSTQGTVAYQYDPAGRRTQLTVNSDTPILYGYDDAGRLTNLTQGAQQVTISYDAAGRRQAVAWSNGIQAVYTYDAASNVKSIVYSNASGPLGDLLYDYDIVNRRIRSGGSLMQASLPPDLTSASYDAANQLLSFGGVSHSLDANGNVTHDGVTTYTWNARDQLTGLTGAVTANFAYDGFGRRSWSSTPGAGFRNFLYDGWNVVREQMGTGTASLLNGPGLDERYARTLNGVTRSYLTDALGSVVGIGSPVGTVNKTYAYEPYGATVTAMSGGVNTYQYTGRENDNTGLYYYRARYYHPRWGRFISSDPIGFAGGDANLYAYVGNNPVSNTDPSGYGPVTGGVCAAFVAGYTVGSFLYTMENLDSTSPLQDQLIRVNKKIGECPAEDTRRLHELDKIRKDLVKALSESVGKAAASNNGLQDVGTAMAVEGICGFLLRAPGP